MEAEKSALYERAVLLEEAYNLDFKIEGKVVPGSGVKIVPRVYLNQDHEFRWPSLSEPEDDGKGFCHALRSQEAVEELCRKCGYRQRFGT